MKIAFILSDKWFRASIDFDGLLQAVAAYGHEPLLVCLKNEAGRAEFPVIEASLDEQSNPRFWKGLNIDAGVVSTCLQRAWLPKALNDAGISVVSRADNDGLCGIRVYPLHIYRNSVQPARGPRDFVRRARHFAARYFQYYRGEAQEIIGHIDACHAVCIETEHARRNLTRFLAYRRRTDLASRLFVVPHSVPDRYIASTLNTARREPQIFCGGRWDDDQKNAELLSETISGILKHNDTLRFVIAGKGSKERFSALAASHPERIHLPGLIPREEMATVLNHSRFLLSSSRWESQPIGALEAVCCGCTVVATPVPGFQDIACEGRFGKISARHRARELAAAALAENDDWEAGRRNPEEIASYWRSRVSNRTVAGGILSALTAVAINRGASSLQNTASLK